MKKYFLFFIMFFLIQSCSLISVSNKRNPIPRGVKLSDGVNIIPTGAVSFFNMDFFPASFMIEAGNKIIYIDPFVAGDAKKADYILITHIHPDHFSTDDIKKLSKKETLILCPQTVSKKLSGYNVKEVKPGDSIDLDEIKCDIIPSYNTKKGLFGMIAHPFSDKNAGYVITIKGMKIYHAGDTDFISEMKNLKDITAALIPISGDNLTMNAEEAASAINIIKPAISIPMHFYIGKNKPAEFMKLVDKEIKVEILQQAE
jgi:L-ascorbate metabolism protein UlaG (beta-lactamase superfamily)